MPTKAEAIRALERLNLWPLEAGFNKSVSIHDAARQNRLDLLSLFIVAGVSLDDITCAGLHVIHYVCLGDSLDCFRWLRDEKRLDYTLKTPSGMALLSYVVTCGAVSICKAVLTTAEDEALFSSADESDALTMGLSALSVAEPVNIPNLVVCTALLLQRYFVQGRHLTAQQVERLRKKAFDDAYSAKLFDAVGEAVPVSRYLTLFGQHPSMTQNGFDKGIHRIIAEYCRPNDFSEYIELLKP